MDRGEYVFYQPQMKPDPHSVSPSTSYYPVQYVYQPQPQMVQPPPHQVSPPHVPQQQVTPPQMPQQVSLPPSHQMHQQQQPQQQFQQVVVPQQWIYDYRQYTSPYPSPQQQFRSGTVITPQASPNQSQASIHYTEPLQYVVQLQSLPSQASSGAGTPQAQQSQIVPAVDSKLTRARRRPPKVTVDVKYPMRYPAHPIPESMRVATGPPGGFQVEPPNPSDILPRRYATGVDERNFLTVLEYEINDQPIIWDYYTGYVHLTGIWKAVGNSKADIVRLLDNSPELESQIKRVRGGFLKIQGTWVPFEVASRLAKHVCYFIRYALVPIFGPDFPDQCTKPNEPGFGTLQLNLAATEQRVRPRVSKKVAVLRPKTRAPYIQQTPVQVISQTPIQHAIPAQQASPVQHGTVQRTPVQQTPVQQASALHPPPIHALLHPAPAPASTGPISTQAPVLHPQTSPASTGPLPVAVTQVKRRHSLSSPHQVSPLRVRFSSGSPSLAASTLRKTRHGSDSGFKARQVNRPRFNSTLGTTTSLQTRRDSAHSSVCDISYAESVFDDDDQEFVSPPPMPRKVSFTNEEKVSETEILAMLKATRSLQQMSAGRPVKDVGGGFECGGKQYMWDGSDRLDIVIQQNEQQDLNAIKQQLGIPQIEKDQERDASLSNILNV